MMGVDGQAQGRSTSLRRLLAVGSRRVYTLLVNHVDAAVWFFI